MKRLLAFCIVSLLACSSFAQVDVSIVRAKSLLGVTNPQPWGSRVLVGADSNASLSDVMLLQVKTDWPNVHVIARAGGTKVDPETDADKHGEFLFIAAGDYVVDVVAFSAAGESFSKEFKFYIGGSVDPPPGPPPGPGPGPGPEPSDIRNEYGLGVVAYQLAPTTDNERAADIFRRAANYLKGRNPDDNRVKFIGADDGRSTDQQNVIVWIRLQLAGLPSASAWATWRSSMVEPLMASQQSRERGFTTDDWYAAFVEIADAIGAKQ